MKRRELLNSAAAAAALAATPGISFAQQQRAICYNCPPEWADWGGMLRLVNQRLNIAVPPDNKNSGQSLAALSMARLSHTQQLELAVVFRFLAGAYKVMCILHKVGECECE